jgi:hypothetical protein
MLYTSIKIALWNVIICLELYEQNKQTLWPEPTSELHRSSDHGCHVVSVTDPYGRVLGFIDRSRYIFVQVAFQLYSGG